MIEYQKAILTIFNKSWFYHPYIDFEGLRICVKLLTWLELIYKIIWLLACKCEAIKRDPVFNRIKSKKIVF